jgi:hypothetical protein
MRPLRFSNEENRRCWLPAKTQQAKGKGPETGLRRG